MSVLQQEQDFVFMVVPSVFTDQNSLFFLPEWLTSGRIPAF